MALSRHLPFNKPLLPPVDGVVGLGFGGVIGDAGGAGVVVVGAGGGGGGTFGGVVVVNTATG